MVGFANRVSIPLEKSVSPLNSDMDHSFKSDMKSNSIMDRDWEVVKAQQPQILEQQDECEHHLSAQTIAMVFCAGSSCGTCPPF